MDPDLLRFPLRSQFAPAILEVAHQFLLLRVHRDHRLFAGQETLHLAIDVFKLCVSVRVPIALSGLAVGLETVTQFQQQLCHYRVADDMSLLPQFRRQASHALAGPSQWGLRVTTRNWLHKFLQVCQNCGIPLRYLLAPASGPSHPSLQRRLGILQLRNPLTTHTTGDSNCSQDSRNPAPW